MIELAAIFLASLIVIIVTYRVGKFAGRAEGFIAAVSLVATERHEREQAQREKAPWN